MSEQQINIKKSIKLFFLYQQKTKLITKKMKEMELCVYLPIFISIVVVLIGVRDLTHPKKL